MRKLLSTLACLGLVLGFGLNSAKATNIMPSLAGAPTGWSTDRYQPAAFGDVGPYAGASNVLAITVDSSTAANERPPGQQSEFYDTQGMGHAVTGGAGDSLLAALYIPTTWADASNGFRRTGLWGVMTDGSGVSGYPIIGFISSADYTGFQYWNDSTATWTHLGSTPVKYGAWDTLGLTFNGTAYNYIVNGVDVGSVVAGTGTNAFQSVILQVVNPMGDSTYNGYTAYWANTSAVPAPVPEPSSIAVFGTGILGLAFLLFYTRRNRGGHHKMFT